VSTFGAFDHAMMRRALDLAARGLYTATPNPRVGCVVTAKEEILGEGWHEQAGGPHAEVVALEKAGSRAAGATLANVNDSVAILQKNGARDVLLMHPDIDKKPSKRERP